MDGLGLPEGRSYVSSCKRTYKVAPGTTSCKWGYIWCPYKWPKIHGYLTVVFSPLFVWRSFEKKSYRIGPQSSQILQSCLGFGGCDFGPTPTKGTTKIRTLPQRCVCKTKETYRCNLSLESFDLHEVFFILHSSMINLHFREMFYIVYVYFC